MRMKRMIQVSILTAFFLTSLSSNVCLSQPTPQLTAGGSGVNLGITRLLAEAFAERQPGIVIEVPGSIGTKGAIKAAAGGAITFGLVSRSLSKEELALGLKEAPYARVPIVIAAHPGVKEKGVTSQELVEIYQGKRSRWKDGREIIVFSREKWDSGFQMLQQEIPGFNEAYLESYEKKRWTLHYTDQDANEAISKTPGAIGVTDLGMISTEHLNLRVLELNGILPSPENLQSGAYPLGRVLSFVYREESLPQGAKTFLEFVRSDTGRKILKSNGYLPLN
jgi:phosphate transport system substrate-binding protein